jgi:hypothetical protein
MIKYILLLLLVVPPCLAIAFKAPIVVTLLMAAPIVILASKLEAANDAPGQEGGGSTLSRMVFFGVGLVVLYGCVQVAQLLRALFS